MSYGIFWCNWHTNKQDFIIVFHKKVIIIHILSYQKINFVLETVKYTTNNPIIRNTIKENHRTH